MEAALEDTEDLRLLCRLRLWLLCDVCCCCEDVACFELLLLLLRLCLCEDVEVGIEVGGPVSITSPIEIAIELLLLVGIVAVAVDAIVAVHVGVADRQVDFLPVGVDPDHVFVGRALHVDV